jgi:uncharacterized protein (DUF433 family)
VTSANADVIPAKAGIHATQPRCQLASGHAILGVMKFDRITVDPAVCGGKPCIRGLRFPVSRLLGLLAAGETREEIPKAYPYLEAGDIDEVRAIVG